MTDFLDWAKRITPAGGVNYPYLQPVLNALGEVVIELPKCPRCTTHHLATEVCFPQQYLCIPPPKD